mmetsp:Transcript_5761/g.12983  ORF Transcript_5761/g.12983 Transcript_5761/m.12983 type:complete len:85 (-) Transcript_5761:374-628(-)
MFGSSLYLQKAYERSGDAPAKVQCRGRVTFCVVVVLVVVVVAVVTVSAGHDPSAVSTTNSVLKMIASLAPYPFRPPVVFFSLSS